jgi:hypothetical protein
MKASMTMPLLVLARCSPLAGFAYAIAISEFAFAPDCGA